jgi:hypothetical protein
MLNNMTEQLNGTSETIRSEGKKPSISADQSLQNSQMLNDLESDYQFFRKLVKNNIFQLTNVSGTVNKILSIPKPNLVLLYTILLLFDRVFRLM